MDAETVAGLLGVSTRTLNNYINLKELPSQGSGRRRTFVWVEVLEWYVRYRVETETGGGNDGNDDAEMEGDVSDSPGPKETLQAAMLRKTRAEANLKELSLSGKRGEVITIADAKVRLDRMMGNLRAKLLGMGPKLASRLEGTKTRTEREETIRSEMETLCREISTGLVVDLPEEPATLTEVTAAAVAEEPEIRFSLLDLYAEAADAPLE